MTRPNAFYPATAMPDAHWWQALWPDPAETLQQLGFKEGMHAIDLCCGDGLFTAPMSKLLNGQVTGVDIDPEMISIAQNALKENGSPACKWVAGDAGQMNQLLSVTADIILIANTFHGVPNKTELAQQAHAKLKQDGRLIIINWHPRPREKTTVLDLPRGPKTEMRMSIQDVKDQVEPADFVFEKSVELPPYHYGAIFSKN